MNIIIEFNKESKNLNALSQAIKIFLRNHNKDYTFTLIGPIDLLFTVNDDEKIKLINIGSEKETIDKSLALLEGNNNALLCLSSINFVIGEAKKSNIQYSNKTQVLITGTRFKTKDFKNPLMLINADKTNDESKESYLEGIKLFNDYLSKSNKSKDKTYKLLVNDENNEASLIEIFKDDKAFKGSIKIDEITKPNCDFIIGNSTLINAFLSTFKMTFEAIDTIKTDKLNDTFLIKIGKSLTASVENQIDRTYDKKTRSCGTILLGFSKPIYFAKNDDTVTSFLDIFEKTIIS
ncbi:MAG: hypothetical protein WCS51_03180 [Bacilli bacterium]